MLKLSWAAGDCFVVSLSLLQEYQDKFGSCNVKLKTIPLFSSWFGETWERSIQTLKTFLYKVISRGKVDYFSLLAIISDRGKWTTALNIPGVRWKEISGNHPNMFLKPYKSSGLLLQLGMSDFSASVSPSGRRFIETVALRNQWLQIFHAMWYNECLLDFRESSSGRSQLTFQNSFQRDDVALIKSPLKPRP